MCTELHSEVSVRYGMEVVSDAAAHTEEIAINLFGIVPNNGLVCMS